MRKTLILFSILLMVSSVASGGGLRPETPERLPADRWIELDLYWFDRENIPQSVAQFLERTYPLYQNAAGWRGVIVNVGFLVDYIAGSAGDLDQRIPLPEFNVKHWLAPQFQNLPYPLPKEQIKYSPWTYRDLKTLGEELRRQIAQRYRINDFKFGSLLLGRRGDYDASLTGWRADHPEIWNPREGDGTEGPLDMCASVHSDHRAYAAFPKGIPEGTPFRHFFAQQWDALSRAVSLDALVLRDGIWGQVEYLKVGPYGTRASANPQDMERWHHAIASLVRETKRANPQCVLLGYSNAVSAVSEWRLDGFDLERIAKEGYLDGWIDQSWGGAWNEYWNTHLIGYSFQLANTLVHAAQLADTPTRHHVLVDTWDAWGPWDTLHTVPEKMRWEIWAYTHAAVKMPKGEKVPRGMYLSWANHGPRLWSAEDVRYLATNVDAATADALAPHKTLGPTLVYNRSFIAWLQSTHPDWLIKEFIEDHAGMLMKWQVPILSITRPEWLGAVHSDLLVFQSPAQLEPETVREILRRQGVGEPLALIGDPTWGIDSRLAAILPAPCETLDQERSLQSARPAARLPGLTDGMAESFNLWQGHCALTSKPNATTVYQTGLCPDLVMGNSPERNWLYWNPPFFSPKENVNDSTATMSAVIADPEAYVLAARAFQRLLRRTGRSLMDDAQLTTDPYEIHCWQREDGKLELLVGNLERDLPHDSATPKTIHLNIPRTLIRASGAAGRFRDVTGGGTVKTTKDRDGSWRVQLPLGANGSNVWVFED